MVYHSFLSCAGFYSGDYSAFLDTEKCKLAILLWYDTKGWLVLIKFWAKSTADINLELLIWNSEDSLWIRIWYSALSFLCLNRCGFFMPAGQMVYRDVSGQQSIGSHLSLQTHSSPPSALKFTFSVSLISGFPIAFVLFLTSAVVCSVSGPFCFL